uniref:Uncharacterized protein n=1 Tax=Pristionchus pacificus TaxID=54126 RepID=A0A8R1V0S4_PRIPA
MTPVIIIIIEMLLLGQQPFAASESIPVLNNEWMYENPEPELTIKVDKSRLKCHLQKPSSPFGTLFGTGQSRLGSTSCRPACRFSYTESC